VIERIEHVCLDANVESLGDGELFPHREIPRLQVWSGDDTTTTVTSSGSRRWCECCRIDPAIGTFVRQQDFSSHIVSTTSSYCSVSCNCERGTSLEASDSAHFPTRQYCPTDTVQLVKEWQVVVVRRHKDMTSIERGWSKV